MVFLSKAEKTLAIHSLFDEVLVYRAKFGELLSEEEADLISDVIATISLLCSLDKDSNDEVYETALRYFRERKQHTN
jgi:hypothetical protein